MTIRRVPEDFVVDEVLRDDVLKSLAAGPSSRAKFAVYRLTKRSLSTPESVKALANAIGVRAGAVSYAGLKDKYGVTTQHLTAPRESKHVVFPGHAAGEGWDATLIGWSTEEAEAAWIRRNRFRLVVRALSPSDCQEMDRRARVLSAGMGGAGGGGERLLLVNYFGNQRFGSARHGEGFAATQLIRGRFEEALRLLIGTPSRKDSGKRRELTRMLAKEWGSWTEVVAKSPRCAERRAVEALASGKDFKAAFAALPHMPQQMSVEAYQSHLWNRIAQRMATSMMTAATNPPVNPSANPDVGVEADDPFGRLIFPSKERVGFAMRSLEVPMLAPETRLADPWRPAAEAVLSEEGITLAELRIPGLRRPAFRESWRPLFVMAERFVASTPDADEFAEKEGVLKRTLEFELPRGAYATVAARALGR